MNWDDLRVFLSVARQGGVTRAAGHLGLDPATVSRKIRRLEGDLGAALFARSPSGVVLTDEGERLLRRTEDMERIAQTVASGPSEGPIGLRGAVRIGAPDGCANFLLPQVCAAIRADNPELCLDIVPMTRSFDLQRREVDIAVAVNEPSNKRADVHPVAEYELIFAASRGLVGNRLTTPSLEGLPLTSYVPELLLDPGLDIPERYRLADPLLRSSSVMVQWQWICLGKAAGLLHDFAFPFAPDLVRLEPDFGIRRDYFLVSRRQEGRLVSSVLKQLQIGLRTEINRLRERARARW